MFVPWLTTSFKHLAASRRNYSSSDKDLFVEVGADFHAVGRSSRRILSPTSATRQVRLFGINITDQSMSEAVTWICYRAKHRQMTQIGFLNAHCVNVSIFDGDYLKSINSFHRIFADGTGMRMAARCTGVELQDNVNGTDMFPLLCEAAQREKLGLYLFGSSEEIAARAARKMLSCFPELSITGTHHGYFVGDAEEHKIIDAINKSGAQILLVGLGVPNQEIWIAKNRDRIQVPVVIGVGGLFDYYSGRRSRAPDAFRKAGMEWIWRLMLEPRRLASRYLIGNAKFLYHLFWYLALHQKDRSTMHFPP